MARRHAPIPSLTVETVLIYRCGTKGRRYLRAWVAYRSAAQKAWLDKYCVCPGADGRSRKYLEPSTHEYGDGCGCHDAPERAGTVNRLARWLRWRDGRLAAMRVAP